MSRTGRALAAVGIVAFVLATPTAASATIPAKYASCKNLHASYPHGVGRATAHDKVAAGAKPVTIWKHDTAAYNMAIRYNKGLDRDRDYIACEKG